MIHTLGRRKSEDKSQKTEDRRPKMEVEIKTQLCYSGNESPKVSDS